MMQPPLDLVLTNLSIKMSVTRDVAEHHKQGCLIGLWRSIPPREAEKIKNKWEIMGIK